MLSWAEGQLAVQAARRVRSTELYCYYQRVADRICRHFKIRGQVLDLGCGTGWMRRYCGSGSSYLGADPISLPGVGCRAVGEYLPFKDKAFETFICYSVLQHAEQPQLIMREAVRVTASWLNVMVCVNDPNPIFLNAWSEGTAYEWLRRWFAEDPFRDCVDGHYLVLVGSPCASLF